MPQDQSAERYHPLKDFVRERGGLRLAAHGRFRDRCVEWAVADWPTGELPGEIEAILRERLAGRTREEYGSVVATLLIGIAVNLICRLIVDWWERRRLNQAFMEVWSRAAKNPDVSPEGGV
jgi:hypothetical protein